MINQNEKKVDKEMLAQNQLEKSIQKVLKVEPM